MERKLAEWRARQQPAEVDGEEEEEEGASGESEHRGDGGGRRSSEKEEDEQNSLTESSEEQTIKTDHFAAIVTVLKVLLWLVLLGLFIELEFGLVYFVFSMFYWIYIGTRAPSEKKQGEVSAYSVFNPGCKAIQGSITAEQFERELQYRPMAGR
ncbi:SAYSvFN domain-containing protein 1 [Rhinoraja longicauda]